MGGLFLCSIKKNVMSKYTESGWTQLKLDSGKIFKINDVVQSGKSKGTIVGVARDGYVLLDTGDEFFVGKLKHITPEPIVEVFTQTTKPLAVKPKGKLTKEELERENARLQRELDECNAALQLPAIVKSAPVEVQSSLPEVRKVHIMSEIQGSAVELVEKVQNGTLSEIKEVKKSIARNIEELESVAPQKTISVTDNCRVQTSAIRGRETIRIYFVEKPNKQLVEQLGKQGFKAYFDGLSEKKEWYYGAFSSEKKLEFAKGLCKEETPLSTPKTEKKPEVSPVKKTPVVRPAVVQRTEPVKSKIVLSKLLQELMPRMQQRVLSELDHDGVLEMQPQINRIERQIADIRQRNDVQNPIVKAHYFYGSSDWFVTEYEGSGNVFGYAVLNGDTEMSELGSASIHEFNSVGRVEMDFYWEPVPLDVALYKKYPRDFPKPEKVEQKAKAQTSTVPGPEITGKDAESSKILSETNEMFKAFLLSKGVKI